MSGLLVRRLARLDVVYQRRELVRQSRRNHLKDVFRLVQIPETVRAKRAQVDSRRKCPFNQTLDDFGQHDLSTVTSRE
jgi:hypothetical protein